MKASIIILRFFDGYFADFEEFIALLPPKAQQVRSNAKSINSLANTGHAPITSAE